MNSQENKIPKVRPDSGWAFLKRLYNKLPPLKIQLTFWAIAAIGFAFDLATKELVFNWLSNKPGRCVTFIEGFFQFVAVENTGAAFGIAAGKRIFLLIVSFLALIIIIAIFYSGKKIPKITQIALAMLTAGICGNFWDRFFNAGAVRDFIDIVYWPGKHWPAFNVADSLLCVGVALILLANLKKEES